MSRRERQLTPEQKRKEYLEYKLERLRSPLLPNVKARRPVTEDTP